MIRPNPLIPSGGVAAIDRLQGRLMQDLCTIERKSATRDAGGALATGGYAAAFSVPCQVTTPGRTATERVAGGRFGPEADYEIRMPRDTEIGSDDRIAVNGQTMQVVYAPDAASFGFVLTVLAKVTS